MFVGHGLLAFALAAALATWAGWSRERVLAFGLLAGAFGLAPDIDILYAPVGLLGTTSGGDPVAAFWETGNVIHRSVTHSLLIGGLMAVVAGLWTTGSQGARAAAIGLGIGVVAIAAQAAMLPAIVVVAFTVAVLALGSVGRRAGLTGPTVAAAAAVGLLSHPFGDLFTGEPPAMLYPLDGVLVAERVVLHPDPTLHLLGAFGLELATAWLAVLVYLRIDGYRVTDHVTSRAALGGGYAAAAILLPPPTLDTSYHFVFSILAVAAALAVGVRPRTWRSVSPWAGRRRNLRVLLTGLTGLTIALGGYAALYLMGF